MQCGVTLAFVGVTIIRNKQIGEPYGHHIYYLCPIHSLRSFDLDRGNQDLAAIDKGN